MLNLYFVEVTSEVAVREIVNLFEQSLEKWLIAGNVVSHVAQPPTISQGRLGHLNA